MGGIMTTPSERRNLVPYLTVRGGTDAITFYAKAFGAEPVGERLTLPNGLIAHAELRFGDVTLFLSDENEDWGNRSPLSIGDTPIRLALHVDDVDAVFERAVEAGCEVLIPLADQFYGERAGRLRDPFGHIWILSQQIEDLTPEELQARMEAMISG